VTSIIAREVRNLAHNDPSTPHIPQEPTLKKNSVDVLVVDDVSDAAVSLAKLLELDGYCVEVALSAEKAIEALDLAQPLCVLLDFNMPGMDGLSLARHIKSRFGDDVVLIAITGANSALPRVAETFALVDHYFTKPIPLVEFRKIFPPRRDEPR
jgi:CheY-like chemotaxis protein